jgi:hypothetical protein
LSLLVDRGVPQAGNANAETAHNRFETSSLSIPESRYPPEEKRRLRFVPV